MRRVEVSQYKEEWASLFKEEAEKLTGIYGEELIDIHHIGSTSVVGLEAKPIIDIMPVVKDIRVVDNYNHLMYELGYKPKGENGIAQRRFFEKGGNDRTHHVHIYQVGSPEIERHLAFRDYVKSHKEAANEYGQLKKQLAQQFPYDIESYIRGKETFVSKIEHEALRWYQS
ncbi:GrpB family protein [Halalkalibacter krulwichiae]|uniref:Dephospho-CoA kinase/protein folding accessory domain-containing protein n=1 Tax=Halalkalibacter krulwichiae TaxID=199441 RepID=A0A1X9MFY3_9BACI|nr:GrpB family protein [Halalkalibacter krulwichiae]ARK32359.1 dephospho-CoA kinase/protein folding accessory domain-containing protein [Halalkalibacter krulwichiae]